MNMCDFNESDYVYQSFWFKNEIKEHYYAGNGFIAYCKDMGVEESFCLALEMAGDKKAFMPMLVSKIESLIGEKNYRYDFWEFSDEDFSLYWLIKKDVYLEKMKLIKEWIKFEELEELIWFDVEEDITI